MRLTEFRVLTFDCYGTLIDWESGIFTALQPLLRKAAAPRSREAATNRRRRRRRRPCCIRTC
jgi:2-haloacid dehalogenase